MAHRYTSEEAARARRQRGGYASVAAHRALGRVPGEIAREAKMRRVALRKQLDSLTPYETGALLDPHGTAAEQLRAIARQENANLEGGYDPSDSVVLDGID